MGSKDFVATVVSTEMGVFEANAYKFGILTKGLQMEYLVTLVVPEFIP